MPVESEYRVIPLTRDQSAKISATDTMSFGYLNGRLIGTHMYEAITLCAI